MSRWLAVFLCAGLAACAGAPKRDVVATPPEPVAIDEQLAVDGVFPAGTPIRLELLTPISSATASIGDRFALRTRTRLVADGVVVVAEDLPAHGEVIHADKRTLMGKPGELLVKLRVFVWQDREIPLRSRASDTGKDHTTTALVVSQLFGLAGLFVTGGHAEIPAGSIIFGALAEPIVVPQATDPAARPEPGSASSFE